MLQTLGAHLLLIKPPDRLSWCIIGWRLTQEQRMATFQLVNSGFLTKPESMSNMEPRSPPPPNKKSQINPPTPPPPPKKKKESQFNPPKSGPPLLIFLASGITGPGSWLSAKQLDTKAWDTFLQRPLSNCLRYTPPSPLLKSMWVWVKINPSGDRLF